MFHRFFFREKKKTVKILLSQNFLTFANFAKKKPSEKKKKTFSFATKVFLPMLVLFSFWSTFENQIFKINGNPLYIEKISPETLLFPKYGFFREKILAKKKKGSVLIKFERKYRFP